MKRETPAVPHHVAIICDGNRRWARAQGLAVFMGHRRAAEQVFEPLIQRASDRGVRFLTFWVFSTENWKRNATEVEYLLSLLREFFDRQVARLHEQKMRFAVIGNIQKFPQDIQERITRGIELTQENEGITVIFALNYGGRDEIVRTVNRIRQLSSSEVTAVEFSNYLDTAGLPDPDFIIRTGGEQRLSGFLLWQSEYAELAFPEFLLPDFSPEKLDELLGEYAERQRRFGA